MMAFRARGRPPREVMHVTGRRRTGRGGFLGLLAAAAILPCGCGGGTSGPAPAAPVRFSSAFESGSIGAVTPLDAEGLGWELALRDDNGDGSLPSTFRTWWYLRADGVPVGPRLRLEFSRLGFRDFFIPVYSYDNQHWQHFDERDVTLAGDRLRVDARFTAATVWIARTFPYTASDLATFLQTRSGSPYLRVETLGLSPRMQLPLRLLTVEDAPAATPRETVWIHARSHPGETGPSYLLEGLLEALLGDDALGRSLRARYRFRIAPMHNPDGVVLGNYRTNAASINLESSWGFPAGSPFLGLDAPLENRLLNQHAMVPVLLDAQAPPVLALNLHASNAAPDTAAFFFPHFGDDPARYSPAQRSLWRKQIAFITQVALEYDGRIEQPPAEGGSGFLASAFPEAWWWAQRQDAVNAITLETTYGRAGFDHWITREDLRRLGAAVARAIDKLGLTPGPAEAQGRARVFRPPFKPEIYRDRQ